jgi:hypothetical protein
MPSPSSSWATHAQVRVVTGASAAGISSAFFFLVAGICAATASSQFYILGLLPEMILLIECRVSATCDMTQRPVMSPVLLVEDLMVGLATCRHNSPAQPALAGSSLLPRNHLPGW